MANELPKEYEAQEVEARWYKKWNDGGVFGASAQDSLEGQKEPYVIMMPPPNVTGSLHNGHALFVTLQDILIRYHRMLGKNAMWLPGVDHAGIATQAVVERELKRHEGKSRHDVGREAFLERVWAWKAKNGDRIVHQLQTLGASADWTRERFTMDEQCNRAVREAFVRMWDDGLIYRGERLVNWDPATQTALSNEEVEYEEKDGELWQFAYKFKEGDGEMVVATTRPETMLGDTAVAVHPDDERYQDVIGKALVHPFFADRDIKVVADDYVDREFGTGAVKITPAHDPNDFDIGQRHDLAMINIFDFEARVNENGGAYKGLDRFAARKKVKEDIEALGLFRGTDKIKHNVSISQRSGVAIEPMLSRQYFVEGKPLAKLAMDAVKSGETRIVPSSWESTWNHFMENIRDWCISRQLWWGHRIPVFYDLTLLDETIREDAKRKGHATSASELLEAGGDRRELLRTALFIVDDQLVRKMSVASIEDLEQQQPDRFVQEEDVLDTWFSAGLWPFSTLGWPDDTDDLRAFYPGAVLETGFDILFFWVARMMMMGCYFMGKAPFADVFLHAMVRDSHGRKMSKSLGNAIDPLDVVNGISKDDLVEKTKTYPVPEKMLPKVLKGLEKEYPQGIPPSGADGLRFSLAALSGQGRDVKLAIPRVAGYRAFLNKIWNATRFALMRIGDDAVPALDEVKGDLSVGDRWILSRLQQATDKARKGIETYRFDETANVIYQFFWTELCDWYIEYVKGALSEGAPAAERRAAVATLVHVLDASMRLLHPLCPFQSEEIWQRLPGRETRHPGVAFCAQAAYPASEPALVDDGAEATFERFMSTVVMIRNARQESDLGAQQKVDVHVLCNDAAQRDELTDLGPALTRLAHLTSLDVQLKEGFAVPRLAAMNSDGQIEVVIPLEGLIDVDKERERLAKVIEKAQKELKSLSGRLNNEKFLSNAPVEVIEEVKANQRTLTDKLARLEAAQQRLAA